MQHDIAAELHEYLEVFREISTKESKHRLLRSQISSFEQQERERENQYELLLEEIRRPGKKAPKFLEGLSIQRQGLDSELQQLRAQLHPLYHDSVEMGRLKTQRLSELQGKFRKSLQRWNVRIDKFKQDHPDRKEDFWKQWTRALSVLGEKYLFLDDAETLTAAAFLGNQFFYLDDRDILTPVEPAELDLEQKLSIKKAWLNKKWHVDILKQFDEIEGMGPSFFLPKDTVSISSRLAKKDELLIEKRIGKLLGHQNPGNVNQLARTLAAQLHWLDYQKWVNLVIPADPPILAREERRQRILERFKGLPDHYFLRTKYRVIHLHEVSHANPEDYLEKMRDYWPKKQALRVTGTTTDPRLFPLLKRK